jgi:hypothetical protein
MWSLERVERQDGEAVTTTSLQCAQISQRTQSMYQKTKIPPKRAAMIVVFGVVAAVVGAVAGQRSGKAEMAPSTVLATHAMVAARATLPMRWRASDAASVKIENGVVSSTSARARLTWHLARAMRWPILSSRLTTALRLAASCWCRASIATGNAAQNAELAKQRHRCQQCIEDRRRRGSN